jgi:hypothetical protein
LPPHNPTAYPIARIEKLTLADLRPANIVSERWFVFGQGHTCNLCFYTN